MATKLKNILTRKSTNIIFMIITAVSFTVLIWSCFFFSKNPSVEDEFSYTYGLKEEFSRTTHNVTEYYTKLKNEKNLKDIYRLIPAEDIDAKEAGLVQLNNSLERLRVIENRLSKTKNFYYYIEDLKTGDVVTNSPTGEKDFIEKQNIQAYFSSQKSRSSIYLFYTEDLENMLLNTSYEVYTCITNDLVQDDVFYNLYKNYQIDYKRFKISRCSLLVSFITLILSLILFITSYTYYIIDCTQKNKYDKWHPIDLFSLLIFFVMLGGLFVIGNAMDGLLKPNFASATYYSAFFLFCSFIGLYYIQTFIRQIVQKTFLKYTFTTKVLNHLSGVNIIWSMAIIIFTIIINLICFQELRFLGLIVVICLDTFVIFSGLIFLNDIKTLRRSIASLSEKSSSSKERLNNSCIFTKEIKQLEEIHLAKEKAVKSAIKSEQLKTNLITNVSHDLKTPLTSIISYSDLLSKENLESQKALEYCGIINNKSQHLKVLIEDLIEASKAATGNLPVNLTELNLIELVNQVSVEFEDLFNSKSLELIVESEKETLNAYGDSHHMFRVLQNLFSNIVKYAKSDTRVYVNLHESESKCKLSFINTSENRLNMPAKELMARFVRGDMSRHSEGNGLGLSIGDSLMRLQKGSLDITIEGDSFKVDLILDKTI